MAECSECNGTGYTFYDDEGDEISEEIYNQLSPNERDKEPCDCCEGTGEIEFDYEPDYDSYDE